MFKKTSFIDITPKYVYSIDISTPYVHFLAFFWHFLAFFKHIISRLYFLLSKSTAPRFNTKIPACQLPFLGFFIGFSSAARDADVTTSVLTSESIDFSCDVENCLSKASFFITFPVCL
ncbi:hypothetical protein ACI1VM_24080, partial [Escherichia coli]